MKNVSKFAKTNISYLSLNFFEMSKFKKYNLKQSYLTIITHSLITEKNNVFFWTNKKYFLPRLSLLVVVIIVLTSSLADCRAPRPWVLLSEGAFYLLFLFWFFFLFLEVNFRSKKWWKIVREHTIEFLQLYTFAKLKSKF